MSDDRPDKPPTSRLGRLARLTALAPRALPIATAAIERATVGKKDEAPTQDDRRKAIENDLKSISLLEAMMAPIGRKYHTKDGLDEIKAVFMQELDYTKEAELADVFRRIHQDDPDIVVPRVHHSLSTKRVLTADFIG